MIYKKKTVKNKRYLVCWENDQDNKNSIYNLRHQTSEITQIIIPNVFLPLLMPLLFDL